MRPARKAGPKSGLASSVLWIWKREDATRIEIARRTRHFSPKRGMTEPKLTSTGERWKADSTPRAAPPSALSIPIQDWNQDQYHSLNSGLKTLKTPFASEVAQKPLSTQGPLRQQAHLKRSGFATYSPLQLSGLSAKTPGPNLRLASPTGATPSSSPRLRWNCPGWSDHT
jgi:hypothetical protein